jgi:putative flippase GtrA
MNLVRALLARLPEGLREFLLYGLASALALALDWGLLFALTTLGMNYLAAAAIGFTSGIAITYALSVKVVFRYRRLADRRRELAAFLAVGVAGLALTQALLAIWVEWIGLAPVLAKAPTAVMVFLFNFGVRRALLFRAPRQAA